MKTKIIIDVPDDDCIDCDRSYVFDKRVGRVCTAFNYVKLELWEDKYQRCKECVDETVEEV